jgi:hypothetical protein
VSAYFTESFDLSDEQVEKREMSRLHFQNCKDTMTAARGREGWGVLCIHVALL